MAKMCNETKSQTYWVEKTRRSIKETHESCQERYIKPLEKIQMIAMSC